MVTILIFLYDYSVCGCAIRSCLDTGAEFSNAVRSVASEHAACRGVQRESYVLTTCFSESTRATGVWIRLSSCLYIYLPREGRYEKHARSYNV